MPEENLNDHDLLCEIYKTSRRVEKLIQFMSSKFVIVEDEDLEDGLLVVELEAGETVGRVL